MIGDLLQDLRYSVRTLRKHALLSIVVVTTLTLGIGVSAGVFTYYDSEFLRARVDKDFDSFVRVYAAYTRDSSQPGQPGWATLDDCLAFQDRAQTLRNLAAYSQFETSLGQDDPVNVRALMVTPEFFALYDLERPLMGRLLQPEDFRDAQGPPRRRRSERRPLADARIVDRRRGGNEFLFVVVDGDRGSHLSKNRYV